MMAKRPRSREAAPPPGLVRLQKFLSDAGVASRRRAEELILEGRVLVNQQVIERLPAFVDPQRDEIIANGARVKAQPHEYFIMHKPKGVVCTNKDPQGRPRAVDLLPPMRTRLFPVGRLDADSSGLLLLTNDGELAARITHPSFSVPKVYRVEIRGEAQDDLPAKMKKGVYLAEGKAVASDVRVIHKARDRSALEITLSEGRNRQVRRMLARLGHPVKALKRIKIGPLSLKALPIGGVRRLSPQEIESLKTVMDAIPQAPPRRTRQRARPPQRGKPRSTERSASRPGATAPRARPTREDAARKPRRRVIS